MGDAEAESEAAVERADVACSTGGAGGEGSEGALAGSSDLASFSFVCEVTHFLAGALDDEDEASTANRLAESDMVGMGWPM